MISIAQIKRSIPFSHSPWRSGQRDGRGQQVTVTFANPNVDTSITLSLGHIPESYIPVQKHAACDVYNGSNQGSDWTPNKIVLRATVATTVRLWIS